ncbi:MAG: hypothetical protein HY974_01650, partial [Candidatus Kerfeldbacteria bacterium]|nr:hypothetical protein [Candidatus Kerfeldbacteria bacterium]
KESGTFGIKKFDSQRFGGMLSAAYFSERLQERPYVYGPLIEEFIRQQPRNRLRQKYLSPQEFVSGVNEVIRQKCAENVCGFLKKYQAVQPEVTKLLDKHIKDINCLASKIAETEELPDDAREAYRAVQKVINTRTACDPANPTDVRVYAEWVGGYNGRLNEFKQVLPDLFIEKWSTELKPLARVKGYPSFPSYGENINFTFRDILAHLAKFAEHDELVSAEHIRNWVDKEWVEREIQRLRRSHRPGMKSIHLPLLRKVAREVFQRTNGKIIHEEKIHAQWPTDNAKLITVFKGIRIKLRRHLAEVIAHIERVPKDWAANRYLVDIYTTLARLNSLALPPTEESRRAFEVNALAGEAKGTVLALAEGMKQEIQVSGLSLRADGNGWALAKRACLAVVGTPPRERLALVLDYSSESAIRLSSDNVSGVRGFGFIGGSERRERQTSRSLTVGNVTGKLGRYGLILPLSFGTSQARRYLWLSHKHRGDELLSAIEAASVNIKNARIIREQTKGGSRLYVALAVERPYVPIDATTKQVEGYIGVDRGESALAVFARVDTNGRLQETPQSFGELPKKIRRAYNRVRQQQSQAKRLVGGTWFAHKIDNYVRQIAIRAVDAMLTHCCGIALEHLSRGFARGGTASWEHQYTKVADKLIDVLSFAGFTVPTNGELFPLGVKSKHHWFGAIPPGNTSRTCPKCAAVWSNPIELKLANGSFTLTYRDELRENIKALKLERDVSGVWHGSWLADGKKIQSFTPKSLKELNSLTNKLATAKGDERRKLERDMLELFKHRHRNTYDRFYCLLCNIELNADKVGALNIARKAIYQLEGKPPQGISLEKEKRRQHWQEWYSRQLNDNHWWDSKVEKMLK